MVQNFAQFPLGPLDTYRKVASFDCKQLKLFVCGQEHFDFEERLADQFQRHPEFCDNARETLNLDETRRKGMRQIFSAQMNILKGVEKEEQKKVAYRLIASVDPGMSVMKSVNFGLFVNAVKYMGTERHSEIIQKVISGEFIGSFALTEIGHGSNTKGMRTTATYDPTSEQFVLHSPDFEAAKCWAGLAGHIATHSVVFAHLITPDGVKRGLHAFVVPIRNPRTLLPYQGVKLIDMGEKIGLNAIENGVVMFDKYNIPRENLLNRHAEVLPDGTYTTSYKDSSKLHGASFANLSTGRVDISLGNSFYLTDALTIAIRYAAVRKQFGIGNENEEIPLLEYQTHQYRLFPYLAAAYCFRIACDFLYDFRLPSNDGMGNLNEISSELHGISSALKPLTGWVSRDGIQECREACGGHGYLKAAGLGSLRNNQDACCTYEGANHVLLQQTSTWLLKFCSSLIKGEKIVTPLKSVDFLNRSNAVAAAKFTETTIEEVIEHKNIIKVYEWLVYFSLKRYSEKYQSLLKCSGNPIVAKNNSQIFVANDLSIIFVEHFILKKTLEKISTSTDVNITNVLSRLMSLYGLWSLQKHIPILYIGGYAQGPTVGTLYQEAILRLCLELKNDAVSLVDTMAVPDFFLNSVLGNSDGQVYKHLESAMIQAPGALSRPHWWKEIIYWKDYVESKL